MNQKYTTIKFYIDVEETYLPFIKVGIDATRNVIMLIDTGAQKSMIFKYLYQEAKDLFITSEDTLAIHGINNNEAEECPIVAGKIYLRGKEFPASFSIASSEVGQALGATVGLPIGGLLGTEFLLENKWIIDYDKKAILIPGV